MSKITLVSDLHVGKGSAKEHIPTLVDDIQKENSDNVFILGDVVHDTDDEDTNVKNLEYVIGQFERLSQSVYFLPGNHDANAFGKDCFEFRTGTVINNTIDLGDTYVTMIDTAFGRPYPNTSILGDEAIQILRMAMKYDPKPIVLSHFPITYTEMYRDSDWFKGYPEGVFPVDKCRIEGLEEKPDIVFCGHMHMDEPMQYQSNGIWTGVLPPFTQFETRDTTNNHGFYATIDTETIQMFYG